MKAQSSIEFLTTYGFMFIIIGVVISILVFVAVSPIIYTSSQCNGFSGPYCAFVQLYSNASQSFSLLTLVLTNSESVPINITNITATIRGTTEVGTCTPYYMLPGQSTVCVIPFKMAPALGTYEQGFYTLNAKFCNTGLKGVYASNCTFVGTSYSGAFTASAQPSLTIAVTMLALQGNRTSWLAPYPSAGPFLPNFQIIQSGYLATNITSHILEYAFGTPGYQGGIYLGQRVVPFPQSVSSLNNNNVNCVYPYNSVYSVFATTLYFPTSGTLNMTIVTDDAMQVYYKQATTSTWESAFNAAQSWRLQSASAYTNNDVIVSSGLYNIEILWSNICGGGVQMLKIQNIP